MEIHWSKRVCVCVCVCVRVQAGDVVCDLEDMDAEWFLGESGGKRGIVPKNYIQVLLDP